MTSWKTLQTNGKDYMTSRKGVFASGDCEYGPNDNCKCSWSS